jgi:hypothetical protein
MTEHEKDVQRRRKAAKLKKGTIKVIVETEKEGEDEYTSTQSQVTDAEG